MLLITEKQIKRLAEFLPDTAAALVDANDINPIIDELDNLVISLFDDNDEPTDRSRVVERFMDDLIWQNLHPGDFPVYDGKPARDISALPAASVCSDCRTEAGGGG